jgi:hypothetical protein
MISNIVQKLGKKNIAVYLVLALISIGTFYSLGKTFYQQDEWMGLGHYYVEGPFAYLSQYGILDILAGGGRLTAQLFQYYLFTRFPFNIGIISCIVVLFHYINSIVVYHSTYILSKNKIASFISSVFFLTVSSSHQAVTWIAASTNTLPSALFALLSVYYYLSFIENKRKRDGIFSYIFLYISYSMKQSSIFIFLVYPLYYLLSHVLSVKNVKQTIKIHAPLFLFLVIIIIPYFLGFFSREQTSENVFTTESPISNLLIHSITYPLSSLSQLFTFPGAMFSIARFISPLFNFSPQQIEMVGALIPSYCISLVMLCVLWFMYRSVLSSNDKKLLLFGLLFTLTSFLPFIALNKAHAYLDSRYFYLGACGGGMLLASCFLFVNLISRSHKKTYGTYISSVFLILFIIYVLFQLSFIRKIIHRDVQIAQERKQFLQEMDRVVPSLPNNPAFFITGNTEYLLAGNYAPFQQGPGFTLMVWYYPRGNVPASLIKEDYLWGFEQGYKQNSDGGFGYYSDFAILKNDYESGRLDDATLIGIYYDASKGKIINITDKMLESLTKS